MPNPIMLAVGGAGASLAGSAVQANAASKASDAQTVAAREGIAAQERAAENDIAERKRQFDSIKELLQPFVEGGSTAMTSAMNLIGVNGNNAQSAAISGIENSAEFSAITQQGEEAILANASATGGLRGGNTQAALSQYRPQVLSGLIDKQYSRLSGLSQMGQAAAAGQATAGQNLANGVGAAYQGLGAATQSGLAQIGAAQAGGSLAQGQAFQNGLGGVARAAGQYATSPAMPEDATMFSRWGF